MLRVNMQYSIHVTPRFGDVDGLRHINNTVLPNWFEQARNDIFKIFNPDFDLDLKSWNLIMAHIDLDFINPLYYGKSIEIKTGIIKIGRTSFTVHHEAWQNNKLAVKGNAVCVHYDFIRNAAVPINDTQKLALRNYEWE